MLQVFGVEVRTETVYRAMIEHPLASPEDIARGLGLPPEVVTAELDLLAELMLVEPGPVESHYDAVPPERALEVLIAREESRLRALQEKMVAARDGISQFVDSFVQGRVQCDERGLVEQIDEAAVVPSRLFQLVRCATRSVRFMLPGPALPPEAIQPSARLDDEVLRRKVPLRLIVTDASLGTAPWRDHLEDQVRKGAQIRSHAAPPLRAVIVDDEVALLPRQVSGGALVVHGPDLVAPVAALFGAVWGCSTPFPDEAGPAGDAISEARMRQVVILMAQGQKDETIARRLGVSVRTVRRLVSDVLEKLQAESRFQAGVLAVQRGWLS